MTQEDKQLLLQDLCGRLPYGVKVKGYSGKTNTLTLGDCDLVSMFYKDEDNWYCKPYLRPMSSMTEEEANEYNRLKDICTYSDADANMWEERYDSVESIDWLNRKMFDYRGLIERNLAISTEVFNPYKN